ncbi:MAG: NAD-dependent dehydratase [Gemmatimonadetes bacterium]|nr:NAD-dependent dehydratase [Gemmatimonadota bacterium]
MSDRTALVVGATGLVGRELVAQLLATEAFGRVYVIARRPLERRPHPRLTVEVADFARLDPRSAGLGASHVFCALGTTIRRAGSQERFRQVDFEYPLAVALQARGRGARHFLLVSALGADPGSRVFYSRVKGELETTIAGLGFESVTIARPSLLLGERGEVRLGEAIGKRLGFLAPGRYRPVHGAQVAAALVAAALADTPGVRILANTDLRAASGAQAGPDMQRAGR